MVQSWLQFRAFGINVFEFSELNDFLLAAFREPQSFLVILGLLVYGGTGIITYKMVSIIRNYDYKGSRYGRFARGMAITLFILVALWTPYVAPIMLNNGYGDEWKEDFLSDPERKVEATLRDMQNFGYNEGWIDNLSLIGTTDKFVFFFDNSKREILTAFHSNVLLIRRAESSNNANAADAE